MRADEIADAFFHAENEVFIGVFIDCFADILKSRENVYSFHAERFRDFFGQGRSDDRRDDKGLVGDSILRLFRRQNKIYEQSARFVSVQKAIFSVLFAERHARSVRVRIGGYNEFRIVFFGGSDCFFESLFKFGVWVWASREISVRIFLFGNDRIVRYSDFFEYFFNGNKSRSVQRSIYYRRHIFFIERQRIFVNRIDKIVENFVADIFN